MEFKIGDRVKVKEFADIPEGKKTKGIGRLAGKLGEVVDKLRSENSGEYVYIVHLDGYSRVSNCRWKAEALELEKEEPEAKYEYEFTNLENVVLAVLYEVKGDSKTEVMRGHGHIIHKGVYGIAQASAYALKKIYLKLGDLYGYEN